MSSRRPCTDSGEDRVPCPVTLPRRWRNADSAAHHPRPARSPPARLRPPAGPTAPPRPPCTAPSSTHQHARTTPETARDPSSQPPARNRGQFYHRAYDSRIEPNIMLFGIAVNPRNRSESRPYHAERSLIRALNNRSSPRRWRPPDDDGSRRRDSGQAIRSPH